MKFLHVMGGQGWIRRLEHPVLRIVSLIFSVASAYAFQWFLSPLDSVDPFQRYITFGLAIGLGLLGYFMSRGLAHRLMIHEPIWGYLPLVLVIEVVEIYTNFAKAQLAVQQTTWLTHTASSLYAVNVFFTYVMYSVVPLVSPLLAVADMDMERRKLSEQPGERTAPARREGSGQARQEGINLGPGRSSVPPRASAPPAGPASGQPARVGQPVPQRSGPAPQQVRVGEGGSPPPRTYGARQLEGALPAPRPGVSRQVEEAIG